MILLDDEIERLLKMRKRIINPSARRKAQKGSINLNYDLEAGDASFSMYVRQNIRIAQSFSCGLLYHLANGEKVTLTRYNGSDHPHSNPLEGGSRMTASCHIHIATQRYMEAGMKPEHYAEPTDRYTDIHGALNALLEDCNIDGLRPPNEENQHKLFKDGDDNRP